MGGLVVVGLRGWRSHRRAGRADRARRGRVRLPLLIGVFGFAALQAVILNKAMSLIVVVTALPARLLGVSWSDVAPHWPVAVNLLAGSLVGAWLGATWATRMRSANNLYRVLAALLLLIACALAVTHLGPLGTLILGGTARMAAGVIAGFAIGIVAAIMGVAGGELIIPTVVLLFGLDIKVAGTLSLAVSLPTMLVAFGRYNQDASVVVLRHNVRFVLAMAAGSVAGAVVGGLLLGVVPSADTDPGRAVAVSAVRVWRHRGV